MVSVRIAIVKWVLWARDHGLPITAFQLVKEAITFYPTYNFFAKNAMIFTMVRGKEGRGRTPFLKKPIPQGLS